MQSNLTDDEAGEHVIDIWEVKKERLALMQQKISENPTLLSKTAGKSSCCIFRVPQSLAGVNGNAYQPRIVSIGPYHLGKPHLNIIQEHKWRYLGSLVSRTQAKGLNLEDYLKAIAPLESRARDCYSEAIQLDSDEFIEMLVLDGVFIIELFRKVGELVPFEIDDPILTMAWILPFFYRDLLKLENQIPFFVLERLFEILILLEDNSSQSPTLSRLAMEFFSYSSIQNRDEIISQQNNLKSQHLLDLVRSSFIPTDQARELKRVPTLTHLIRCVSNLRRAGIKINQSTSDSFLHVTFKNGVIEMPTITVDDFMISFLLNCVAFEQCYSACSKHVTTYVTLLDCLINTFRDVEYLCDRNIIENHLGTDGAVAHFINSASKDVAVDMDSCYLSQLFNDVHHYYGNGWHVQWASFKYTYFDTPWSFISALAAFVLLVLTVAQTYLSAVQAYGSGKSAYS